MAASLEQVDPEIWRVIRAEAERQQTNLELIASENVVSRAVLEAQGLTVFLGLGAGNSPQFSQAVPQFTQTINNT